MAAPVVKPELAVLATPVAGAGRLSYTELGRSPLAESRAWRHIGWTGHWLLRPSNIGTHLTGFQTHDTPIPAGS